MKKAKNGIFSLLFLAILALCVLSQSYAFSQLEVVSLRALIVKSGVILFNSLVFDGIVFIFGVIYAKKKTNFSDAFHIWITSVITLIITYLIFVIRLPKDFNYWNIFGVLFPILTSTLPTLAGIVFSLFAKNYLDKTLFKKTIKDQFIILTLATVLLFILLGGTTIGSSYSIWGLYLILPFSWGEFFGKNNFSRRTIATTLALTVLLLPFVLYFNQAINQYPKYQQVLTTVNNKSWNLNFLVTATSPYIYLVLGSFYFVFKGVIKRLSKTSTWLLVITLSISQAPFTLTFLEKVTKYVPKAIPAKKNFLMFLLIGLVIAIVIDLLVQLMFRTKQFKQLSKDLDIRSLAQAEALWKDFWKKPQRRYLVWTVLYFYALDLLSFYIVSDKGWVNQVAPTSQYIFGARFGVQLLTLIYVLAMFFALYFITTRFWVGMGVTSALVLGISIADKIKIGLRNEPVYPSEFSEIVNWKTLFPMVGTFNLILFAVLIIGVIALIVWLERKHPVHLIKWKSRLVWGLIGILILMTPLWVNKKNSVANTISSGFNARPSFSNPKVDTQIEGPVLTVVNYANMELMDQPGSYSQEDIQSIAKKYQSVAKKINKTRSNDISKQTIIFNLSESFVDPTTFPTVNVSKDPMPYIRSLSKKTTAGYMLSAGYGGGTANMEYETLTGFNMGNFASSITPYTQVTNRFNSYPNIGNSFNYSSAIHPFIGTWYGRVGNYHLFGFDKYAYLGSKYKIIDQKKFGKNPYNSDITTYQNGLKQINAIKGGQFINLISIQNHMPYPANMYPHNEYRDKVSGKLIEQKEVKDDFATYTKGIEYTDKAVKRFISQIDKIKKPITLVFYGDHYPAIINQTATNKYPIQMHATTYFIYSNKYARSHGASASVHPDKYVSPTSFTPMVLKQTDSKVSAYQALLTKIYEDLPAITINYNGQKGIELVDQNGKEVPLNKLTKHQRDLLKDYQLIQYDMSQGKGYSQQIKGFYK